MKRFKVFFPIILGLLLLPLVWAVATEPYLIDEEVAVAEIPNLSAEWRGQTVGLVADLQVGMWLDNTSTIRRIVQRLVEKDPAFVLIAGDFIYLHNHQPTAEIRQVVDLVSPLTNAGIPTYAVLGNHDYASDPANHPGNDANHATGAETQPRARQLRDALEAVGVRVLQNEAIALLPAEDSNSPLYLVGIGAHRPGQDEPVAAVRQVPAAAPRLVFMHNPASFQALPPGTAPVALAGHTHGGQVRIPFLPEWTWMKLISDRQNWEWIGEIRGDEVSVSGWIEGYGAAGNQLYITRGIGFSDLPIRFNCRPELTLLRLQ